ncbi:MAG: 4-phosphoerythronate dehydrogenase PdxB [Thiopseudomonas sp.]|nr:4-phosphoerythronate dehydrogenase PdxB [Thiopseudomonas sp.]MCK9464652.1 4-phosphoerythronate dehydrogenase PdxB [Thiopseudomonas sp.]
MHIVIDENIPETQVFAQFGRVVKRAGRAISAADVREADALIVRSITQVNRELLQGSAVKFVGTCTIGTDHLDLDYLNSQKIAWTNAPGCNAQAVVEYVLAALQVLAQRTGGTLSQRVFGIVGAGQVGQRLANVLRKLGYQVLLCDPPRQQLEAASVQEYVELATILAKCDVISIHTPLDKSGNWPTLHMFSAQQLAALQPGTWLINAARGAVIDNQSLLACLLQRKDLAVVLDVWEPEPEFNPELAALCQLATPHIAGYSLDGKIRGTEMIFNAFCQHFNLTANTRIKYPEPLLQAIKLSSAASVESMRGLLTTVLYDPRTDDAAMRMLFRLAAQQRGTGFDSLRKNYPIRRELATLRISGQGYTAEQQLLFQALQLSL